jgi:hypothetical protein
MPNSIQLTFPPKTLGNLYLSAHCFPHTRTWIGQGEGSQIVNFKPEQIIGIALAHATKLANLETNQACLAQMSSADLSMCKFSPAILKLVLAAMPTLKELRLDFAQINPGDLNDLEQAQKLETLWLTGSSVSNSDLKSVAKVKTLTNLLLKSTQITREGLEHLSGHPQLERLHLPSCVGNSEMIILKTLPNLQELDLSFCPIEDSCAQEIAQISNLHTLYLNDTKCGDGFLIPLRKLEKLNTLFLNGTKITDQAIDALSGLKQLTHLDLRDTKISQIAVQRLSNNLVNCAIFWP